MSRRPTRPPVHPFDRAYGTDTSGLIPGATIAEGTGIPIAHVTAYYGVAPSILTGALDLWLRDLRPGAPIGQTTFLDIGAGKGRAVLLASRYPFRAVEGVELNADLAAVALRNIMLWQANPAAEDLSPIRLHEGDATEHPLPDGPALAYLFHPFEAPLLRKLLSHIDRSLAANPRPFDLLYVNAEHDSLLDRHPTLRRIWIGKIGMSAEDHVADLAEIAGQEEYGSTGDELCAFYRFQPAKICTE